MKNVFVAVALFALVTIGCHGQIPPSQPPSAALSWTASTSAGSNGCCVYAISRATATGSTCPVTTGTAYALVGTTAANVLTFTDTTVQGNTSYCWINQAQQGTSPVLTSQPSAPSNSGVPLAVQGVPLAPGAPNVTATAELIKPAVTGSQPQVVATLKAPTGLRVMFSH